MFVASYSSHHFPWSPTPLSSKSSRGRRSCSRPARSGSATRLATTRSASPGSTTPASSSRGWPTTSPTSTPRAAKLAACISLASCQRYIKSTRTSCWCRARRSGSLETRRMMLRRQSKSQNPGPSSWKPSHSFANPREECCTVSPNEHIVYH